MSLASDHREELTGRFCLCRACLAALLSGSVVANTSQGIGNTARKKVCLTGMPASKVNCNSAMALKKNWIVTFGERFRRCHPPRNKLQGEVNEREMYGEKMKFPLPMPILSGGTACTPGATGLGNLIHSCDFWIPTHWPHISSALFPIVSTGSPPVWFYH